MIRDGIDYLKSRLKIFGYKEHFDGFDDQNVPRTLLRDSYYIDPLPIVGVRNNMSDQEVLFPIQMQVFLCPVRDNTGLRDKGYTVAQNIINDIIRAENRLTFSTSLKDVRFRALDVQALNSNNDNGVRILIDFEALIIFTAEDQDC